jgi:hypothetical protein
MNVDGFERSVGQGFAIHGKCGGKHDNKEGHNNHHRQNLSESEREKESVNKEVREARM